MLNVFGEPKFLIQIEAPKTNIIIGVPSKGDYLLMLQGQFSASEYIEKYGICKEIPPLTESMAEKIIEDIRKLLKEYRDKNKDYLEVPQKADYRISQEDNEFPILTHADNLVYRHSGLTFREQLDLPITEYWLLLADAVKIRLSETESGREYLNDCYTDMHAENNIRMQGVI